MSDFLIFCFCYFPDFIVVGIARRYSDSNNHAKSFIAKSFIAGALLISHVEYITWNIIASNIVKSAFCVGCYVKVFLLSLYDNRNDEDAINYFSLNTLFWLRCFGFEPSFGEFFLLLRSLVAIRRNAISLLVTCL